MKTIVVLGMHRSATSLVARTLHSEVNMGSNLLCGYNDNPKGHYENVEILQINKDILEKAGGSWDNPPSQEKILECFSIFDDRMRNAISKETEKATKMGLESWGFKDPRTCLTIDLWMPFLENPQFVVCYRKPLDVAKSLKLRNNLSIDKGLKLTEIYNQRIHNFMTKFLKNDENI
jgi:hypothetical protein